MLTIDAVIQDTDYSIMAQRLQYIQLVTEKGENSVSY